MSGSPTAASTPVYVGAGSRDRNGRAIAGTAIPRAMSPLGSVGIDYYSHQGYPFSPWGRWYPWYAGGWGYGYFQYSPWISGSTRWIWGRNSLWWYGSTPWYDPWYDPWYYNSYSSYGGGRSSSRYSDPEPSRTGAVRIRVSPEKAKVFIDGVLQGTVDDFNGLGNHLQVDAGPHRIEIKIEGYATLADDLFVEAGKTQTFRGSLKKTSK